MPKISNGARIFLISFLFLIIFSPNLVQAAGLVPCGGEGQPTCNFCHFFELTNNIIKFVMTTIVPMVAVLMLIIGGVLFFFAGAKPDTVNQAKGIITSVVIGLLIIFSAWVIVNTVLKMSGIIEESSPLWKWYEIPCEVR